MLPTIRTGTNGIFPSLLLEEWPFDPMHKAVHSRSDGDTSHRFFATDVAEYPDRYVVCMDVPGICRECIDISMETNTLSIKIEDSQDAESEGVTYLHRGRWHGSTTKLITLPEVAFEESVEACLQNGVLRIELKKLPEKQSKKIAIKAID